MKKKFIFIVLMLVFFTIFPEKVGVLREVLKPQSFEVINGKIYIVEGAHIFIYSADDGTLIKKFGSKGEGPGELSVRPIIANSVFIQPKAIFAVGINKVIYYDLQGNFIRELKKPRHLIRVFPVAKNYAVNKLIPGDKGNRISVVAVHDKNLKEKKELCRQEVSNRRADVFMAVDTIQLSVFNDKIYVEDSKKGFIINVYDPEGTLISNIEKKNPPLKVTNIHKEELIEDLKNDPLAQSRSKAVGGWEAFEKRLTFNWPEVFPSIKDLVVTKNKIYVQTFNNKNKNTEYKVLDPDGQNMKSVFLPKLQEPSFVGSSIGLGRRFYGFHNEKFYFLYENEDEEEWEVHSLELKSQPVVEVEK
jgi:hypothetical protein